METTEMDLNNDVDETTTDQDPNFAAEFGKNLALGAAQSIGTLLVMFAVGHIVTKVRDRKARKLATETNSDDQTTTEDN